MNTVRGSLLGALVGLAWAAALRGYMAELAGSLSQVDWWGTFGAILLPGALIGALLGAAYGRRARGPTRGLRWFGLAPLLFGIVPLLLPGGFIALVTQGLGGGAIAVGVAAVAAGFAISGAGPLWGRILAGIPGFGLLIAMVVATPFVGGPRLAVDDARGAWVAVLLGSLLALLALAASIPFRPVPGADPREGAGSPRPQVRAGGRPPG
ncbi:MULTISPECIES: hypothetical protein [unclassified Nocardiopsis]|uniref:hypothetical protein n=1 Tax=Nocardiopsis TaxID=2013 RepID=UPI00387AE923